MKIDYIPVVAIISVVVFLFFVLNEPAQADPVWPTPALTKQESAMATALPFLLGIVIVLTAAITRPVLKFFVGRHREAPWVHTEFTCPACKKDIVGYGVWAFKGVMIHEKCRERWDNRADQTMAIKEMRELREGKDNE